MEGSVEPLLHTIPVETSLFKVTDPPWQKVVGPPAVTTGAGGNGSIVTTETFERTVPHELLTKTE
jgi:hypothetical protein